jgi:hypothetical protein
MSRLEGYLAGYRSKEAGYLDSVVAPVAGGAASAGASIANTILPYILVLPAMLGIGTGIMHSKLTSPTPSSKELVQKRLEQAELKEFETDLMRRRLRALEDEKASQGETHARTLRL